MINKIEIKEFQYDKTDEFKVNFNQEIKNKVCFLVGGNGTGKSTVLKLIIGLLECSCKILVENNKKLNNSEKRYEYAINNIFYVPDTVLFENEYIRLKTFLKLKKIQNREILPNEIDNTILKDLSHGNRKKANMLDALNSNKNVLVLDEFTNGIDINSKAKIIEYINNSEKQIIFATHDVDLVDKIVNKGVFYFESKN